MSQNRLAIDRCMHMSLTFFNKSRVCCPLQRFSSVPKVLATVRHSVSSTPQDAMNIWIEDLKEDNFRICLREVKTFDGKHQNLEVVSLHHELSIITIIT